MIDIEKAADNLTISVLETCIISPVLLFTVEETIPQYMLTR
jgi:hypothetical protein